MCKKEEPEEEDKFQINKEYTMYIYGSTECPLCYDFMEDLDKIPLVYTDYYINQDQDKMDEMWDKLKDAGLDTGYVGLPVVDLIVEDSSHILIRPDIEKHIIPLLE